MNIKKTFLWLGCFIFTPLSFSNNAAPMHDPTEPLMSSAFHEGSSYDELFNLQSIIISPFRRLAMVNGKLVGTGSSVDGARVLAIDKNHVVLFYAGRRKILYLFGGRLWKAH